MSRSMFTGSLDDLGFLLASLAAEDGPPQLPGSSRDGDERRGVAFMGRRTMAGNGARAVRGLRGGPVFVLSLGSGLVGASATFDGQDGMPFPLDFATPGEGFSLPLDSATDPEGSVGNLMMQAAMEQALRMMVERTMEEQENEGVPPASELTRDALPRVVVTKEDLIDSTNSKCSVCLDEYKPGMRATRMLCGHLFCTNCIREWLRRANSCPVCRFELATDNQNYEPGRIKRMEGRRVKLRAGELNVMRVPELKRLMRALGISGAGCVEKNDLIRTLKSASVVELCKDREDVLYDEEDLQTLELPFLRTLMERYRLPSISCDMDEDEERAQVLQRFAASGWLRTPQADQRPPAEACKSQSQAAKDVV